MLGPIELLSGGKTYKLGARKERGVLAILLWELGHPVPAETLVSRIWGHDASANAFESLYQNVSRLRMRLRTAGGTGTELPNRLGSYQLDVSRLDVDAWRFRALSDDARGAAVRGDDELAVALFAEADALWRGIPLDGLDGDWVEGIRARLNEERLSSAEQRIRAGLRLGRHADLVGEIADLSRQDPFNEILLELHLRALYGSGRQAEALSTWRQADRRWREEVGGDLGRALRNLHQLMLHDDPTLSGSARSPATGHLPTASEAVPPMTLPSTMPGDNPDFTGRAAELETLSSWLGSESGQSTVPIAVISGMPGVGKSAFAVHAAHLLLGRYPDQLYLSLRGHDPKGAPLEPAAALGTLLRKLDVPGSVIPADAEDRAALWRFKLADRKALILLDDALDADQVLSLLPGGPGCLVLVTTRRRTLILPGMLSLPLDPMPQADADELFTRTAGAGKAADRAAVASVVRLCGYLPLEIQLAGRRLRRHPAWNAIDLASRLADIRSGDRDMTTALALSYRYLTAGQQRLFRMLALHPGDSFPPHAAAAMAGDASPAETERALEILLDFHLIEEPVPGRYQFHARVRDHAAELAATVDSEQDQRLARQRLLDYYLGLADHADRIIRPFDRRIAVRDAIASPSLPSMSTRRECMALLEAEKASLLGVTRYAAGNGWPVHAGLLAHLLGGFLDTLGDWTDAIDLHRRAVDAWRAGGNAAGEAAALVDLGFILCRTGRHAEAAECARDALAIARSASDRAGEATALHTLGIILTWAGTYADALTCHDQALAIWRDLDDRHGEADALGRSVMAAARLGRHPDALRRAELALSAYRELGDLQGETNALNNLGGLQQDARCYEDALISYQQAKAAFLEIGDRQGEAIALSNIGGIRRLSGRHDEALRDYRTALTIFRDIGDRRSEAETLNGMAATFADASDQPAALSQYERALALGSELSEPYLLAASSLGIGSVHLRLGSYAAAADDYRTAAELSRQIGDPQQEADSLYGLGCALLQTDGKVAGREPLLRALVLFQGLDSPQASDVRARLQASDNDETSTLNVAFREANAGEFLGNQPEAAGGFRVAGGGGAGD